MWNEHVVLLLLNRTDAVDVHNVLAVAALVVVAWIPSQLWRWRCRCRLTVVYDGVFRRFCCFFSRVGKEPYYNDSFSHAVEIA